MGYRWELEDHIFDTFTSGLSDNYIESEYDVTRQDLRELFDQAFFDLDASPEQRAEARDVVWEWMMNEGWDISDFPWDEWREWYAAQ